MKNTHSETGISTSTSLQKKKNYFSPFFNTTNEVLFTGTSRMHLMDKTLINFLIQ